MTPHRFTNIGLFAAILAALIGIQYLDARDLESEIDAERRDWAYAQQACWRTYGAQAQPEYNDDGVLICRTRRGEALAYRGNQK